MSLKRLRRKGVVRAPLWVATNSARPEPMYMPPPDPLQFLDYFERTPPDEVVMQPVNVVGKPWTYPMYLPYRDYSTRPGEVAGRETGFIYEALYPAFLAPGGFNGEVKFDYLRFWMLQPRTGVFWRMTTHNWNPLVEEYGDLWEALGLWRNGWRYAQMNEEELVATIGVARETHDTQLVEYCVEQLHLRF